MILPFINPCYCVDSRVHYPIELEPTSKRRRSDVSGAEERQIPSEEGSEEYRNTEEAGSASRVDVGSRRETSTSIARSHMVSLDLPVCRLDCKNAWETLTKQEKHYAHHFCQAAWAGARICAFQPSQVISLPSAMAHLFSWVGGIQKTHYTYIQYKPSLQFCLHPSIMVTGIHIVFRYWKYTCLNSITFDRMRLERDQNPENCQNSSIIKYVLAGFLYLITSDVW